MAHPDTSQDRNLALPDVPAESSSPTQNAGPPRPQLWTLATLLALAVIAAAIWALVGTRTAASAKSPASWTIAGGRLYIYSADGGELWSKGDFGFRLEDEPHPELSGSFAITGIDGATRLFANFVHSRNYPTVLMGLDRNGAPVGRYWSNGYIEDVLARSWNRRPSLFASGAKNETRGASLAIFEDGRLSGTAPARNPSYRCRDCPAGGPSEFLAFPRRGIARLSEATATAYDLRMDDAERLSVLVGEGRARTDGWFFANVWYTIGPELTVLKAEITDSLLIEHARLERAGELDHPFGPSDELDLFPVPRCNGSGYSELPLAGLPAAVIEYPAGGRPRQAHRRPARLRLWLTNCGSLSGPRLSPAAAFRGP